MSCQRSKSKSQKLEGKPDFVNDNTNHDHRNTHRSNMQSSFSVILRRNKNKKKMKSKSNASSSSNASKSPTDDDSPRGIPDGSFDTQNNASSSTQSTQTYTEKLLSLINDNTTYTKKYIFTAVGAHSVGKSSIIYKSSREHANDAHLRPFQEKYAITVRSKHGDSFITLIDTKGGRFAKTALNHEITIGIDGYAIIFSILDRESFQLAQDIHELLMNVLMTTITYGTREIPRVLVGTKMNANDHRRVTENEAKRVAQKWGIPYLEICIDNDNECKSIWKMIHSQVEENEQARRNPTGAKETHNMFNEAISRRKKKEAALNRVKRKSSSSSSNE